MSRRTIVGAVALFLAGVLAAAGASAWWARQSVLDEQTWVNTTSQIARDPVVQRNVADQISQRIVEALDVQGKLGAVLPGPLSGLSGPATQRITDQVDRVTLTVVHSDAFLQVFGRAMRAVHPQLVRVLKEQKSFTTVENDTVVLDLGNLAQRAQTALVQQGIPGVGQLDLSGIHATFPLIPAPGLQRLQHFVTLMEVLAVVLPGAAVVLALFGLIVASDRGLGLVALGVGALMGAGAVFLVGVVVRHSAIDALTGGLLGPDAAAVIVDTVRSTLHAVLLVVAALGGLAVLGGGGLSLLLRRRARSGS